MGDPRYTISSLEKIAIVGGKIRDLPSWHHFSIKERVDCLWHTLKDPGTVKRHNRFVAFSFVFYLTCIVGLGYVLNFSALKEHFGSNLIVNMLKQQIVREPDNVSLHQKLAMVYHKIERFEKAIGTYERILDLDPNGDMALNNLAWLLVTTPEERLRDPARALTLAEKAVSLKRSPIYLDTLAEAYYVNGLNHEAIETIKEALSIATEGADYYEKQLKKFMSHRKSR